MRERDLLLGLILRRVRVGGPHGEVSLLLVFVASGGVALEVHRELEILTIDHKVSTRVLRVTHHYLSSYLYILSIDEPLYEYTKVHDNPNVLKQG